MINSPSFDPTRHINNNARNVLAAAGVAASILLLSTGCSSGAEHSDNTPVTRATEQPVNPDIAEADKALHSLEQPVVVLAEPLRITERARERTKGLRAISNTGADFDRFSLFDIEKGEIANARAEVLKVADPEARTASFGLINTMLAKQQDSLSSDIATYPGDDSSQDKKAIMGYERAVKAIPATDRVRTLATHLLDLELAIVAAEVDPGDELATTIAGHITDPKIRKQARLAQTNETVKAALSDDATVVFDAIDQRQTTLFSRLYDGSEDKASSTNDELKAYTAAHATDGPNDPALRDIVFAYTNPEDVTTSREILAKIPNDRIKKTGYRYLDTQLAANALKVMDSSATTADGVAKAEAIVDTIADPKIQKIANAALDAVEAEKATEKFSSDQTDKDAMVATLLKSVENLNVRKLAQAANGGNYDAAYKLSGIVNDNKSKISDIKSSAQLAVYNGSNLQAKGINESASKYLAAQR